MIENFTRNDMLRYFYGEMNLKEKRNFKSALKANPGFMAEYESFTFILNQMDKIHLEPSQNSIQKILDYSKNKNIKEEKV